MVKPKIYALKADTAWRPVGSTGPYIPFLNATDSKLSFSIETVKQKSNGNTPGTIVEVETGREASWEVTLQSRHKENIKHFLYANSVTVDAATTPIDFTLPTGTAGSIVDLGHSNITDASFGSLVQNVDYLVRASVGSVEYLKDITSTPGTFKHTGYTKFGIFSADAVAIEVLLTSEKSGAMYILSNVKLSPADTYQLISDGNDLGNATLKGTLIAVSGLNDPILGPYGVSRTAD